MRLLAALLLVSCGSSDADFGERQAEPDGGETGGATASGGRGASGGGAQSGGVTGAGGHACAPLVGSDDCLPRCEEDADCEGGFICVNSMQNHEGEVLKVCRPECTSQDHCQEPSSECMGFRGAECLLTCSNDARFACGHENVCNTRNEAWGCWLPE